MATEMERGGGHGMREGPTAPRVLLTADPAHFSQLPHHFVSAYRRFARTRTRTSIHRAIHTRAGDTRRDGRIDDPLNRSDVNGARVSAETTRIIRCVADSLRSVALISARRFLPLLAVG